QLRANDQVVIGRLPLGTAAAKNEAPLTFDNATPIKTADQFTLLPLIGDTPLAQDWDDLHSFAGLVPGQHWVYGVPYWQPTRAIGNPADLSARSRLIFVAYAPPENAR